MARLGNLVQNLKICMRQIEWEKGWLPYAWKCVGYNWL